MTGERWQATGNSWQLIANLLLTSPRSCPGPCHYRHHCRHRCPLWCRHDCTGAGTAPGAGCAAPGLLDASPGDLQPSAAGHPGRTASRREGDGCADRSDFHLFIQPPGVRWHLQLTAGRNYNVLVQYICVRVNGLWCFCKSSSFFEPFWIHSSRNFHKSFQS